MAGTRPAVQDGPTRAAPQLLLTAPCPTDQGGREQPGRPHPGDLCVRQQKRGERVDAPSPRPGTPARSTGHAMAWAGLVRPATMLPDAPAAAAPCRATSSARKSWTTWRPSTGSSSRSTTSWTRRAPGSGRGVSRRHIVLSQQLSTLCHAVPAGSPPAGMQGRGQLHRQAQLAGWPGSC